MKKERGEERSGRSYSSRQMNENWQKEWENGNWQKEWENENWQKEWENGNWQKEWENENWQREWENGMKTCGILIWETYVSSIKNDLKIVFYVLIYFSCFKMAIHCFYCMHKSNYLFIQVDIYFFNHQGQFYHDY